MENKYIIIVAVFGFLGSFFQPLDSYELKKKKKNDTVEEDATICIDSLRNVNDSLINALQIENRLLKDKNLKYKKYIKRHGKKLYR